MSRRGFTLLELLVVVGIVSVLVAIVSPAVGAARRSAKSVVCLSQMRQVGLATALYAQDNRDQFPRSSHSSLACGVMPWGYALSPYLGHGRYKGPGPSWDSLFNGLYRCGEDHRRNEWSYGKNVWFELTSGETGEIDGIAEGPTFPRISSIRAGGSTIMFGELASGSMGDHIMAHFWYFGGQPEVDSQRHGLRSNYDFVDGHAEARVFETTFNLTKRIDLWRPGRTR